MLKTDRQLQSTGRASYDCMVRQDQKITVVKWLESKPIHVAFTENLLLPAGAGVRKISGMLTQPVAIKNIIVTWEE